MRALCLLLMLGASAAVAQEQELPDPAKRKILDLEFRVTDLAGNPVEIAGRIEDMRVKETPTDITIELAADVLFDFDKADVRPAAEETLRRAATFVRQAKGVVRIAGHTDSKGDYAYNLALSRRRADSIRSWFAGKGGLSGTQFTTDGLGEKKPIAPNEKPDGSDDPEGRQKNRRVEIVVRKV